MPKSSTTRGTKRRVKVKGLSAVKTLTAKGMKKVKGGELKEVLVTSVKDPAKSGRQTKLMEEEGIYY
jgi:hypothetical protein